MASSFVRGTESGTITRASTPKCRAANATPCAMLPALQVYTPRASSVGSASSMALVAPRILNDPIGCKHSSLSHTSQGGFGTSRGSNGVHIAAPAIRSRAASIASSGMRVIGCMRHDGSPRRQRPGLVREQHAHSARWNFACTHSAKSNFARACSTDIRYGESAVRSSAGRG